MEPITFDFAILGDNQPEGLLVAAGLLRKGFSVAIIKSSALEELPSEEEYSFELPAQFGVRRFERFII